MGASTRVARQRRPILSLALECIGDARLADLISEEIDAYVVILDDQHRILFLNDAVAAAYDVKPGVLLGQRISRLHETHVARERDAVHRHVFATHDRVYLLGMLRGVLSTTFYHPFAYDHDDLEHPFLTGDDGLVTGPGRGLLCMARRVTEYRRPTAEATRLVPARCHELGLLKKLSLRELEVLYLSALGLTAEEVADRLHRTRRTVESHRLRMARKLGVRTSVQLARVAVESGLTALAFDDLEGLSLNALPWTEEELAAWSGRLGDGEQDEGGVGRGVPGMDGEARRG